MTTEVMMSTAADHVDLLGEMQPAVEELLERHLRVVKDWHPHTLVPWSRGRDFDADYEWDPSETELPEPVRAALYVNLLTEDNLPYYFRDIERMFGRDGAWGEWTRRWTAEEGRHSTVIRDYLTVTRAIDPVWLEEGRMAQICRGEVPEPPTPADGLVYVSLQELATRISHRNTGALIEDRAGYDIMRRVAQDENHHFLFYRDAAQVGFSVNPSLFMQALERQVTGFAMPGTGIPGFSEYAKMIANEGIYDFVAHYEQILDPVVMKFWDIEHIEGLDADGEKARDATLKYIAKTARVAERMRQRREERASADA